MYRLSCEVLEGREVPAQLIGFDPVSDLVTVTPGPGRHTVSIDSTNPASATVTVDGVKAAEALANPPGLPALAFLVDGTTTTQIVAQNNTTQNWAAFGGAGDDTLFGGRAALNILVPLSGNDIAYSILAAPGPNLVNTVVGATPFDRDVVFVNGNSTVAKKPQDPQTNFFVNGATPGSDVFRQDANGQLTITPTNNGSFVQLDEIAPGTIAANFDLGDGAGRRFQTFQNVTTVAYFGGTGRDVFVDNTGRTLAAYGGAGSDFLLGGPAGVKVLKGLDDADFVVSRSADRSDVSGNKGPDVVIDAGTGPATFRVGPEDVTVAGVKPGDQVISP